VCFELRSIDSTQTLKPVLLKTAIHRNAIRSSKLKSQTRFGTPLRDIQARTGPVRFSTLKFCLGS
jgi:hypothetical protein